jgi:hypothetical protein
MQIKSSGPNNPNNSTPDEDKKFRENYAKIFGRTAWKRTKLNKKKNGQGTGNKKLHRTQS